MTYLQFKNSVQRLPFILSRDIAILKTDKQAIRNQLTRWQNKGLLIKLKRGLYILNANDRKINPSRGFIANQLCAPSYISLEYALNFYGLIPERVPVVTSITTKKTIRFTNELGAFTYQHIKPQGFKGFRIVRDENGFDFFIAEPEKAVVDFLYLNLRKFNGANTDIFYSSYRFQNTAELNPKRVIELAAFFDNAKLDNIARLFCEFTKEEEKR